MKDGNPALSGEIKTLIERYLAIQEEECRIQEEKAEVQDRLNRHMAPSGFGKWLVEVAGKAVCVRRVLRRKITYDESMLRQRLGSRYGEILLPDPVKVKAALPSLLTVLEPVMDKVGSPSSKRIKDAIQAGRLKSEDFDGAYEREQRELVAVTRAQTD